MATVEVLHIWVVLSRNDQIVVLSGRVDVLEEQVLGVLGSGGNNCQQQVQNETNQAYLKENGQVLVIAENALLYSRHGFYYVILKMVSKVGTRSTGANQSRYIGVCNGFDSREERKET